MSQKTIGCIRKITAIALALLFVAELAFVPELTGSKAYAEESPAAAVESGESADPGDVPEYEDENGFSDESAAFFAHTAELQKIKACKS